MLSLFFTFFVAVLPRAHAEAEIFTEAPLAPNPHRYEFKGQFDFLSTNTNYLSGSGQTSTLYNGGKYSDALLQLQLSYDIDREWRLFGGVSAARADATGPDANNNMSSSHSTGFDEGWAGAQYWYRRHGYSVIPQADVTLPFFTVDPGGDNPLLGEGAVAARASLWIQLHFAGMTPFAYGGYEYRNGGRSSLLPYRVGLRFRQAGSGWVQGEFRGYQTLNNDSNTFNISQREGYLQHVDGGSYEFYSMNASHGEFALSGGFELGEIGIYAGGALSAFGRESAKDFTVTAGITLGGKIFTESDYEERDDGFKTPTRKYDEKFFQENRETPVIAPAEPAEDEDVPEIYTKPKPKPKKHRLRPNPDGGPSPDVQLIMKDTEKALEKKTK